MQCGTAPVFLAGDACGQVPVLHEAASEGALAGRNATSYPAVHPSSRSVALAIMFTDPPLAVLGRPSADGDVIGSASYTDQGRAKVEARNAGLVRLYADREHGRLVGAAMLGPAMDHMAHLLAWAIERGETATRLLELPFYHPTFGEGLKPALREICKAVDVQGSSDGANGGNGEDEGGLGASVTGVFHLSAGDVIEIIVGENGENGEFAGGGGGGTFIYDETTGTLLEAAGGGGGGGAGGGQGAEGQAGTSGTAGTDSAGGNGGSGGTSGHGGRGGSDSGFGGGGGGGYVTAGTNGAGDSGGGKFGSAWSLAGNMSGGAGSPFDDAGGYVGDAGGYGGGGGGDDYDGGGGGGGANFGDGGGGGSYVNTTSSQYVSGASETTGGNTHPQGFAEIACFAAGTRILTVEGEIPVEHIKPGDTIITLHDSGATSQTVTWTGQRTLNLTRHPHPEKARPIRFAAGSLADNVPARDLYLSPDHALYIDGILVPAKALLNGASIRQITPPSVTYYHIELAEHSIILAEGAPAETYLETGNRSAFENAADVLTLHPDFAQTDRAAKSFAPFLESGPQVEAIRARLLTRANIATTPDPAITIAYHKGAAIIQSRYAIPGLTTPDPRDRRRLGVKIARILVGGDEISVDHPALVTGWYEVEPDGRWTDGNGVIPTELLKGEANVTLILAGTLAYPVAA